MPPKQKTQCGNPLWLAWMEEYRDDARERNIKSAETYTKACRSLAACPVTYHRPRDLVCLQGIGPKIAGMLETRWRKYCEDEGLPVLMTPLKKGKEKAKDKESLDDGVLPNSDLDSDAGPSQPKKRKAAPKPPKQYIPQRGSGGYGILLALVLAVDRPELTTTVYLTKSEIIRGAKEYSESSYEHSEKGSYFTAWTGMKTLVNKGLVYVTGSPHKYCLTEDGYDVAVAIRNLRPEFAHMVKHAFNDGMEQAVPSRARSMATSLSASPVKLASPALPVPKASSSIIPPLRPDRFQFWYIDPSGHRIPNLSSAMIRLDHDEFINLRKVEYLASQRDHPYAKQLRLVEPTSQFRDGWETIYGFVVEDGAPPSCSQFDQSSRLGGAGLKRAREADLDTGGEGSKVKRPSLDPSLPAAFPLSPPPENTFTRTASAPSHPAPTISSRAGDAALRRIEGLDVLARTQSDMSVNVSAKPRAGPRLSSHMTARTPMLSVDDAPPTPVTMTGFDPEDAIVFPAGAFDIILILDAREIESKSTRDNFSEALRDRGVHVETRALRLGDMLWIARRRDGLGGEEDECVLDYVVERKRLDDLCTSIKDGRYNEQCFRLSNSCINHVYYVVEDWDVRNRMQYDGKQIMTAKSQIQVHNRFFLKETSKLSQTVEFLATMTKVITASHLHTDLHVIPTRYLSRSSYSTLQENLKATRPGQAFLTSFEAYQDLNDKNASRTLKVAFGRMLLCVKGMSAERVSAMLDIWETPRSLWDDLKARVEQDKASKLDDDDEEMDDGKTNKGKGKGKGKGKIRGPELFFADRVQGEGRRKIGDALSRELYRVFMGDIEG